MSAKASNYIDVCHMMAGWTLRERVRFVAEEMGNLSLLLGAIAPEDLAFTEILLENYEKAVAMCDGNWEPRDPPGWEGGFADNH